MIYEHSFAINVLGFVSSRSKKEVLSSAEINKMIENAEKAIRYGSLECNGVSIEINIFGPNPNARIHVWQPDEDIDLPDYGYPDGTELAQPFTPEPDYILSEFLNAHYSKRDDLMEDAVDHAHEYFSHTGDRQAAYATPRVTSTMLAAHDLLSTLQELLNRDEDYLHAEDRAMIHEAIAKAVGQDSSE